MKPLYAILGSTRFAAAPLPSLSSAFVAANCARASVTCRFFSAYSQSHNTCNESTTSTTDASNLLRRLIDVSSSCSEDDKVIQDVALPGIPLKPLSVCDAATCVLRRAWQGEMPVPPQSRTRLSQQYQQHETRLQDLAPLPCQLVSTAHNQAIVWKNDMLPQLSQWFDFTFQSVVDSSARHGFLTHRTRFDLFHGHLFGTQLSSSSALSSIMDLTTNVVGMLFHCYEYPAIDSGILPNVPTLGYCQENSTCYPTLKEWRFRNVLWLTWWLDDDDKQQHQQPQALWLLDGNSSTIARLRMDNDSKTGGGFGPDCPNTVWEGYLGRWLGDVYNVHNEMLWVLPPSSDT